MWEHDKKVAVRNSEREFSLGNQISWDFGLGFPRTMRNKSLLLNPPSLQYFLLVAWANTMDIFKHTHSNNTATTIKKKKISSHDLKTHLLKSITLLQSVIQQHFLSNTGFKLIFSPQGTNSLRRFLLFETPWTIQFMEFSRPEYWSG